MSTNETKNSALPTIVEAQKQITEGLSNFDNAKKELTELAEKYKGLKVESLSDKAGLVELSTARKELKAKRVEIEKAAKTMRDFVTPISKHISSKEKELVDIISPVEEELYKIEKYWEAKKEEEKLKAERLEQERINARINKLLEVGFSYNGMFYELGEVSIDAIQIKNFTAEELQDVIERGSAEQAKIELIRKEKELEELRAKAAREEEENRKLREEKEKMEEERRELLANRTKMRHEQLSSLGLLFNGSEFRYKDVVIQGEQVARLDSEEWNSLAISAQKRIIEIKDEEERERKKEEEKKIKLATRSEQLKALGLSLDITNLEHAYRYKNSLSAIINLTQITGTDEEEWDNILVWLGHAMTEFDKEEKKRAEELMGDKEKLSRLLDTIVEVRTIELTLKDKTAEGAYIATVQDLIAIENRLKAFINEN